MSDTISQRTNERQYWKQMRSLVFEWKRDLEVESRIASGNCEWAVGPKKNKRNALWHRGRVARIVGCARPRIGEHRVLMYGKV